MTMGQKFWLSRREILQACGAAASLLGTSNASAQERVPEAPLLPVASAFSRVTFEISLKPFRETTPAYIERTCEELFRSWAPLLRRCDSSAVMLWAADGSEILEYRGKLEDEFDWARYLGDANPPTPPPAYDPERKGTHGRHWLYMPNPPHMTYGILRTIVRTLRETGRRMTGKPVQIGATFDPGGEFAVSDFKFHRHKEIASGSTRGPNTWVDLTAKLNADKRQYAGYPNGIPQDTPFASFFGRQSQHFLSDLGFDYIWFSNGLGFSLNPWDVTGPLFDGKRFDAKRAPQVRDAILSFWRNFRSECRAFPIETRGSNLIVGADLASSASPVADIYRGGFNMAAPPNSPWAALDGDFGLEIVGYLSRIAELPPGDVFPFRFYTHDPWWLNSPWLDRYGRDPHDIYLPLALARVNGNASITRPANLEFLSVDNSWGQMPEQVPNEVTPHLLSAMQDYSDAPGLVTWVYPFDEYHEMTFGPAPRLGEVFFGDWFMRSAVNNGFPLNSVVSTRQFVPAFRAKPDFFRRTILLAYLPAISGVLEKTLLDALRKGNDVLAYGPIGDGGGELVKLLALQKAAPISGDLEVKLTVPGDIVRTGAIPAKIRHRAELSAGGVDTVLAADRGSVEVAALTSQGGVERVYAVSRAQALGNGSGMLGWVRGSFCSSISGARLPTPDDPGQWMQAESLMRMILARFGYSIRFAKSSVETRSPLLLSARHKNGFYLSSYSPSTTTTVHLRFPHGAPVLIGTETWLEDGHSSYTLPRALHKEVRCLLDQTVSSEVSCVEAISEYPFFQRRLLLKGLKNATVHFYPENERRVVMQANDTRTYNLDSLPYAREDDGTRLVIQGITGQLLISW
ncbi:MAG: hypothetical protein M3Y27_05645 [Acidobacteriota bacterium]|nr:hypothetical protein [Acidobacteriota bacterium]